MVQIQTDASHSFPLWNHFEILRSLRQWYCLTLHPISKWFENRFELEFCTAHGSAVDAQNVQNHLTIEKYVMDKWGSARFLLRMDRRDIYCKSTHIPTFPFLVETFVSGSYILLFLNVFKLIPVASFTKWDNPRLAKRPLVFNGCLANRGLTSIVKRLQVVQLAIRYRWVRLWLDTKQSSGFISDNIFQNSFHFEYKMLCCSEIHVNSCIQIEMIYLFS